MAHVFALVRLLLAGVLTVAGSAKLADPAGTRRAFVDLGGPTTLAPIAAWLLPLIEITAALALLSREFALAGALVALALFAVFTLVLGVAVARGGAADCHCFGQLTASPVSGRTLARTGVLTALAGVLVFTGRGAVSTGVASSLAAVIPADLAFALLLLAAVGSITWGVAWTRESRRREHALTERVDVLERRLGETHTGAAPAPTAPAADEGLPVGAPAPRLADAVPPGHPQLTVFVSANCPPCKALLPEIATWREQLGEAAALAVVSRDDGDGKILAEAFRARWTPAGVLVGGGGRIASPLRYGSHAVRELFESLRGSVVDGVVDDAALHRRLGSRLGTTAVVVGDPVPVVDLFDAAGQRCGRERFAGEETLVLFWDPECTYCQGMTRELKAIEAAPPAGTPNVAFVVPRDAAVASARQAAFSSPSFFDPDSRVAPLFGARGTPSAVLVDRDGRIASTVAVGKDPILTLLAPVRARLRAADSAAAHPVGMR